MRTTTKEFWEPAEMLKGFLFKILAPRDIAGVLSMIGVHPTVTPDMIDKPTADTAAIVFLNLSEFAYDMDIQQVKAQMSGVIQHAEIYDDAMDVVTVFKLASQLAAINHVEDFSLTDVWEPSSKRFRAVLSGIVNFCRYKEAQVIVITGMKEDLHVLDSSRLELVDKSNQMEQELAHAQEKHSQELHDTWAAEQVVQEARGTVDKLQRQGQSADRVVEDAEKKKLAAKDRVEQLERRIASYREQVADLQGQIAESPEGIEREIEEFQLSVSQQKARLREKTDEKRARGQRDHMLSRLLTNIEAYKEELNKVAQTEAAASATRARCQNAREDLGEFQASMEASRSKAAELEQGVYQVTTEIERAKQAHEERLQELEARRQRALLQHEGLQAKRTEEQKQHHALQSQRLELEAEVASARRALDAELNDLHAELAALLEENETYDQQVDLLLTQYNGEVQGRAPSPDVGGVRRLKVLASPSPARTCVGRRRYLSASPLKKMP